jgi:hypothetical protein
MHETAEWLNSSLAGRYYIERALGWLDRLREQLSGVSGR